MVEKLKSKRFRQTIKEENYSIYKNEFYFGHLLPSSGSAENIASSIISYLNEAGSSVHELDVIGRNGTITNTGWKTGVVNTIEKNVKRPLPWGVCHLHFNELLFRHLFQTLDGETTGPKLFSVPIGTQFSKCEKLPVILAIQ